MSLDDMYGEGAAQSADEAAQAVGVAKFGVIPKMAQHVNPDGTIGLSLEWVNAKGERLGLLTFTMDGTNVRADNLTVAPSINRTGILTEVLENFYPAAEELGVTHFGVFVGKEAETEKALRLTGMQRRGDVPGGLGCMIPNPLWVEYKAWVDAGRPAGTEPQWHKDVEAGK